MSVLRRITALLVLIMVITIPAASYPDGMGNFMKDTLEQLGNLAPHAYQGQQRGYFIGGSLSTRVPADIIQPFSYTPPSIKVGCNG